MLGNYCVYDSENLANNEMVCFGAFNVGSGEWGCSSNTRESIEHFFNPELVKAGLVPLKFYELGEGESAVPNGYYKRIDSSYLHEYTSWLIDNKAKNKEKPLYELFERDFLKGEKAPD